MWWNDYDRLVYEKDNILPMASNRNWSRKLNPAVSRRLETLIGENKDRLSWKLFDEEEVVRLIDGLQNVSHAMFVFNEEAMRNMLLSIGEKELVSKAKLLEHLNSRTKRRKIEMATKAKEEKRKEHVYFPALKKSKFRNWNLTKDSKEKMEKFMKHALNFGNGMEKSLKKLEDCKHPDEVLQLIQSNILDACMDSDPDEVIAKEIENARNLTQKHGE